MKISLLKYYELRDKLYNSLVAQGSIEDTDGNYQKFDNQFEKLFEISEFTPTENPEFIWEFIEDNFPNYERSELVAENNDLFMIINNEADLSLIYRYKYLSQEQIASNYHATLCELLKEAIKSYINKN